VNKVLKERSDDVAAAMRGLCDAVGKLALVRDEIAAAMEKTAPGSDVERLALKLNRTVERLTDAAASVPDECWAIMLMDNAVGGHEVQQRIESMIQNSLVLDTLPRRAVA
jgi:hypothetical protein